jgi:hypothetical protein
MIGRFGPVQAQQNQKCTWTYISDSGTPNLGEDGKVDQKDASWKAMSDGGWHLKLSVVLPGQGTNAYVFERCN